MTDEQPTKGKSNMKIIDAHMHFSNIQAFYSAAEDAGVDYSYDGYLSERLAAGIETSVCMGLTEATPYAFPCQSTPTPMIADLTENPPPGLHTCLGINPNTLDSDALNRIHQSVARDSTIVGFKIYAGYYHYYIHDEIYSPVYEIAAEHGLTVAIHTGVTYSEQGLMEYSHPLAADRLAVRFRDTQFILCHMGNPWIMDACEIAYKNRNVFLDMSGLIEGNTNLITNTEASPILMHHFSLGLAYLNNYKKVLFGTDWPIVPIQAYINFCKKLIPEHAYEDVFYNNAKHIYKLSYNNAS
ncbi:MAG: amidohydrolase family protein [Defluviitaleaceae bacterium]|nr:amidohydrolase family protein [Defluviitaleaceae bacterium]